MLMMSKELCSVQKHNIMILVTELAGAEFMYEAVDFTIFTFLS